jgi:hypothetical protein
MVKKLFSCKNFLSLNCNVIHLNDLKKAKRKKWAKRINFLSVVENLLSIARVCKIGDNQTIVAQNEKYDGEREKVRKCVRVKDRERGKSGKWSKKFDSLFSLRKTFSFVE